MILNKDITLDICGLGIIMYSDFATAHINADENYLSENYWNPQQVKSKNNNVSISEIDVVGEELGIIIPKVYCEFLAQENGFINDAGIIIYGTEDLVERNETLEVNIYAKGYVAIGDDSGGLVFLMKGELDAKEVIAVDCGYMNPNDEPEIITHDLQEWILEGCSIKRFNADEDISYIELHDIIIFKEPKGDIKELLLIKKTLGSDLSIGEILKGAKEPPFTIIKNMPYGKAVSRVKKLGQAAEILNIMPSRDNI